MGRELKRVPLDFDWPLGKVWNGFLNPHPRAEKCPACTGSGLTPEAKKFSDQWYGHAEFDPAAYGAKPLTVDDPNIVAFAQRQVDRDPEFYLPFNETLEERDARWAGRLVKFKAGATLAQLAQDRVARAVEREARRLWDMWKGQWCHHLIQADVDALAAGHRLWNFTRTPTADEMNAAEILGMGHDAINQSICLRARCEREGIAMWCTPCEGSGAKWDSPEAKALYEAWSPEEPPTGEGFQLWETVSEGAPISSVLPNEDAFVTYLVQEGYSQKAAKNFVKAKRAVSAVIVDGKILQNIETCALHKDDENESES